MVKVLTAVSLCGLRWFNGEQEVIYYSRSSCSLSYLGFCDNGIRGINIRDQQIVLFFFFKVNTLMWGQDIVLDLRMMNNLG